MGGVGLKGLVERLETLAPEDLAPESVLELLSGWEVPESSLRPFVNFREDKYARNLVHRSTLFDVIVLCWKPGQATPIHDHSGQCGWVRVLRGKMRERLFALGDSRLDCTSTGVVTAGPTVVGVDRERAIHALDNPLDEGAHEDAVTLHLYSRPHDTCNRYDPQTGARERVQLQFDTQPDLLR